MKFRTLIPVAFSLAATAAFAQGEAGNSTETDQAPLSTDSALDNQDTAFGQDSRNDQSAAGIEGHDLDGDGMLSREEYDSSVAGMSRYDEYDLDGDGQISEEEYGEIDTQEDLSVWDANQDGYLDNDEFNEGSFSAFDDNEDGHWDGDEWDDAGDEGWWDI